MLSQLPPSAVTIQSPSNNLRPDVCYEEFSIGAPQFIHSFAASASATPLTPAVARADFSSLGGGDVGVISLSTKYKELGHCEPAIAGAGTITTTDYDNAECSDEGDHSDAKGGAGGDAPNTAAVQFGPSLCHDLQSLARFHRQQEAEDGMAVVVVRYLLHGPGLPGRG